MLEIERIDVEGVHDPRRLLQPHGRTIEVDQQPLVRIEVKRVGPFDALHQVPEFRTDESRTGVSGVHVQPDAVLVANGAQLVQGVERARGRRTQRRDALRKNNN